MDVTLSTSVSTLRTLPFPTTTTLHHKSHHFISSITKRNTTSLLSNNTSNTAKSSSKTATLTLPHNNNNSISPQQTPITQNRQTHQNPAVGYAAALLESARRNHALEAVARDVKKMSKWLRISQGLLMADEKIEFLEGILEKGKFQKLLVKLVRLLVVKNDVGFVFVGQVLSEFQRLFNQLLLTSSTSNNIPPPQVVLISPGVKMEESEVAGIARRVQMISGAETVKVRRIVHRRVPSSFAV